MYFRRLNREFKSLNTFIKFYSKSRKTHYEVLKLRRNCSDKEIKDAFIQMSKEYHPDKNKDVRAQEKFVEIVEAYNVLGKPGTRAQYDNMTEIHTNMGSPFVYKTPYSYPHYGFAAQESKARSSNLKDEDNYYGFNGLKRVPNFYIIAVCCGIAVIGLIFQMYLIRNLYYAQRRQAQEKSKYLAEELERVRASARANSNDLQTRILLEKIVASANPAVATASLGQALANEKK